MSFLEPLVTKLAEVTGLSVPEVEGLLSTPPDPTLGDLALPCFQLAKRHGKAPDLLAAEFAPRVTGIDLVTHTSSHGAYLNVTLDTTAVCRTVLDQVAREGVSFGNSTGGAGSTVVVDYSAPNIAKHLAVHHIRSTMIGNALVRLNRAIGCKVVGVNHLGDWGTGFGNLIAAYRTWPPEGGLGPDPVGRLNELYVRFSREAKDNPVLEEAGRAAFRQLEAGDADTRKLWEQFRELSLATFMKVYHRLGVTFDNITGESFYEDRLQPTIRFLEEKGLVITSEGARVVDLDDLKIPPCILVKQDGATLYATRDLAAAIYRQEQFQFNRMLYVVDRGQALHFRQIFEVLKRAGLPWADRLEHVQFGVLRFGGKKTKTREGNVMLLSDVLDEAARRVLVLIQEKNPDLPDKEKVAADVGTGAVVFNDMKNRRTKDIDFVWEEVVNFEGDTGPYIQFAHVRISGILRKSGQAVDPKADPSLLQTPEEKTVALLVGRFPALVARAARESEPSVVASYLLDLARAYHQYNHNHRVLGADPALTAARLRLSDAVRHVLAHGLALLGIAAPEQM